MTAEHILVLAWLVLAHLVADFLLQTDAVVADKFGDGLRAWRGLLLHAFGVAVCLVPFAVAFGLPGLWLLLVVTIGHVVIDWWKTRATRAAEAKAMAAARGPDGEGTTPEALGPAWTPVPALLFVLDQLFHAVLIAVAWVLFLARAEPTTEWSGFVEAAAGGLAGAELHRGSMLAAVLGSLLIVNVRAGAFFVAALVRPRGADEGPVVTLEPPPPTAVPPVLPASWRVRVGPLEAVAEPSRPSPPPANVSPPAGPIAVAHASPVRIGAAIGILERLLIVIFVLSGAVAAIGFVVAAKTLARFKQLDDRDFAEYYLLGTLASVAVGLGSALLAQAVLATIPA